MILNFHTDSAHPDQTVLIDVVSQKKVFESNVLYLCLAQGRGRLGGQFLIETNIIHFGHFLTVFSI